MNEVDKKLGSFLRRDYSADVSRLNNLISKSANGAGLEPSMPPFPYSGNPFALQPTNCVALVGLNPKWLGMESSWASKEYLPTQNAIDRFRSGHEEGFQDYKRIRASYFDDNSQIYYGTYFTKLGNFIGKHLCGFSRDLLQGDKFARSVFRRLVYKTDFLPWFSRDASQINWGKVAVSKDDALRSYYDLVSAFLTTLRPRWIQCNGKPSRELAELLFDFRFQEQTAVGPSGNSYRYWIGQTTKPLSTPIIAHSFSRVHGEDSFAAIGKDFREKMGSSLFKFD